MQSIVFQHQVESGNHYFKEQKYPSEFFQSEAWCDIDEHDMHTIVHVRNSGLVESSETGDQVDSMYCTLVTTHPMLLQHFSPVTEDLDDVYDSEPRSCDVPWT